MSKTYTVYGWDRERPDGAPTHPLHQQLTPLVWVGRGRLVLVRDKFSRDRKTLKRSYAYLTSGDRLQNSFIDVRGRVVARVPKRFHAEVSKMRKDYPSGPAPSPVALHWDQNLGSGLFTTIKTPDGAQYTFKAEPGLSMGETARKRVEELTAEIGRLTRRRSILQAYLDGKTTAHPNAL